MNLTVHEFLDLWLSDGRPTAGPAPVAAPVSPHWTRTRRSLAKHLAAAIGTRPAAELTARDVWAVQQHCAAKGLAAETTNKTTHHVLSAMLRDLEDAGELPEGTRARTFKGARKLRANAERACTSATIEERDAILRAFRHHWALPLVTFLFFSGVRIGEACGLRQRDIDWSRARVSITRSRRGNEISPTKSRRSQREIRIPQSAIAAISVLRDDTRPDALLFVGARGGRLNADSFRARTWYPMLKKHGLRPIRIHDTRHTFATHLVEAGTPVAKVARALGHDVTTCEERYLHPGLIDDIDERLAGPRLVLLRKAG